MRGIKETIPVVGPDEDEVAAKVEEEEVNTGNRKNNNDFLLYVIVVMKRDTRPLSVLRGSMPHLENPQPISPVLI